MAKRTRGRDPDAGGVTIPDEVKLRTTVRIERHAEAHFKGSYRRIDVRFWGTFCYIDAYCEPGREVYVPPGMTRDQVVQQLRNTPTKLCRLRYFGDEDAWSMGFFKYSDERYALSPFASGEFYGTPEQAFEIAAGVYLEQGERPRERPQHGAAKRRLRRSRGKPTAPEGGATPLGYTNRMGQTYYLHQGQTKTGKPRYFVAKTVRANARAEMPKGFEFSESINGVVSVRRVSTGQASARIPDTDLAMVRAELARHPQLRDHRADVVKGEIVVFEPGGGMDRTTMDELSQVFGLPAELLRARMGLRKRIRYDPVMKFSPAEAPGHYEVCRMTYRGAGGWSYPLGCGPLRKLVRTYLKHVGTDGLFELF